MGTSTNTQTAAMLADLNDLLQLDRDAVQAYTLAEQGLKSEAYKESIRRFKGDHERHIAELARLVEVHGGTAAQVPHVSSSPFKLAAQGLGDLGSDTTVLLAFKANERLSRDKYQRAANAGYPAEVHAVLRRGADDESAHYAWVEETLRGLGAGEDSAIGKVEKVVETGHAKLADVMEGAEKQVMRGAAAVREKAAGAFDSVSGKAGQLGTQLGSGGMRNVWIAFGVGIVAAQLVGRGRSGGSAAQLSGAAASTSGSRRFRKPTRSPGADVASNAGAASDESRDWGTPAL